MAALKAAIKALSYPIAVPVLSRRLRSSVIVLMLHRVLSPAHPEYERADAGYRFPPELLRRLCGMLTERFDVIDVKRLLPGAPPLSGDRPSVLLTFDDGWRDNLELAAPVLAEAGVRPVVFLATDVLDDPRDVWWQDALVRLARTGTLHERGVLEAIPELADLEPRRAPGYEYLWIISARIAGLEPAARERAKDVLVALAAPGNRPVVRQMVRRSDLPELARSFDLGLHGHTHTPLTHLDDPRADVAQAIASLEGTPGFVPALAFPHGRFDDRTASAAFAAGAQVLFNSREKLNTLPGGMPGERLVYNRVHVGIRQISSALTGRFSRAQTFFFAANRPAPTLVPH